MGRLSEHFVASVSDVVPGATARVTVDGVDILLCNVGGDIFAIADVCTHDGAPLDQGTLDGACVTCPRHGAVFDVRTGEALALPAFLPVLTFPVRVEAGNVLVDL